MISLKEFKKIFNDIKDQEDKNEVLSKILVCKDSTGWIDYGCDLIDDIILVLSNNLDINKEDDLLFWWLYDAPNNNKFCYEDLPDNKTKRIQYNLNRLDDLYYYATKQFDKVKKALVDIDPNEKTYQPTNINFKDIFND